MHKIKTFEQFLADMNKQESVKEESDDRLVVKNPTSSEIISKDVRDKTWNAHLAALEEAAKYEADENPEHTFEGYITEYINTLGSTIGQSMDSNHFFNTLRVMAAQVAVGGDAPQTDVVRKTAPTVSENDETVEFKNRREEIKEYLDECIEAMKEAFSKKLDEVKKNNNARSIIVANMLKKNNENKHGIK